MSEHEHHIVPPSTYRTVLVILMILMGATIAAAKVESFDFSHTHLIVNLIIALAIAGTKMTCIMLFFMHVKYSSALVRIFAVIAILWLPIMFVLTFQDYLTRSWHSPFAPWPF